MPPEAARDTIVERAQLVEFVRPRHHGILSTTRRDGRPQLSPVTMGVDPEGRIVVSTYPERAKAKNATRDERVSVCVLSDEFGGEWVQVDGRAEVVVQPEAVEALVTYFRSIGGEHPDWDEYRAAMVHQGKVLLRVTIERWGPISRGGFPPRLTSG
ncbi:MAG: PPOX class F420-dependent oxidoreductase [Acidimicrobiales bacterium]